MSVRKQMIGMVASGLVASFALLPVGEAARAQEADRVYLNATIYTVDEAFSTASAMAVKDGRFLYVGDAAGARAHIGPGTFVLDLEGKTVIPGLHEPRIQRVFQSKCPDSCFIDDHCKGVGRHLPAEEPSACHLQAQRFVKIIAHPGCGQGKYIAPVPSFQKVSILRVGV